MKTEKEIRERIKILEEKSGRLKTGFDTDFDLSERIEALKWVLNESDYMNDIKQKLKEAVESLLRSKKKMKDLAILSNLILKLEADEIEALTRYIELVRENTIQLKDEELSELIKEKFVSNMFLAQEKIRVMRLERQKTAKEIKERLDKENHEHGIDKRLISVRVDFWNKFWKELGVKDE